MTLLVNGRTIESAVMAGIERKIASFLLAIFQRETTGSFKHLSQEIAKSWWGAIFDGNEKYMLLMFVYVLRDLLQN